MTSLALPILQISLIFDYLPNWLGPTLVFFGVELILVGAMNNSLPDLFPYWSEFNSREKLLVVSGFSLGPLFLGSSVLQQFGAIQLYAILLFCLGRVIEGAAAVMFYKKVLHFVRYQEFSGNTRRRFKRILILFFVMIIAGWLIIRIWEQGGYFGTRMDDIKLVWTLWTLFIATFGISYKLRFAENALGRGMKLGFILCVGGAEIFNLTNILDYFTVAAGTLAYSIGFWIAFILLVKSERHRNEPLFG